MRKTLSRFVLALLVSGAAVHLLTGAQAQGWNVELVGKLSGTVFDVQVEGNYAYCATGAGLMIADVSNPAQPREMARLTLPGDTWAVAVSGSYACAAARFAGLRVIDISNPAQPREVGSYQTWNQAWDVTISGNYAYVAADLAGLQVIDISNPTQPRLWGSRELFGQARSVVISTTYAYVAAIFGGLRVIDISSSLLREVGYYENVPGPAEGVAVADGYAYVATWDAGLWVIDVGGLPFWGIGSYDTPGLAKGVAISGSYAYVADGPAGLRVIDISDPTQPREVGYYATGGWAWNVAAHGDYVYVADTGSGLLILRFTGGARTYSVSGQVQLQDYQGDVTAVPVTVEVRQNGSVVRTEVLSLDAQGGYTLANLAPGTYELAFKANHWLRRVRTVEVVASDVLGVDVSLVNGDVDGDNEVGLSDFGGLVSAFGSMPGDTGWNPNADLNGDGEVSMSDFGILLRRFGEVGDE